MLKLYKSADILCFQDLASQRSAETGACSIGRSLRKQASATCYLAPIDTANGARSNRKVTCWSMRKISSYKVNVRPTTVTCDIDPR